MIITCNKCSTRFNLDDSLVKQSGSKCRCAVCNHIFTVFPLSPKPEDPLAFQPSEPAPPQPEPELPGIWEPQSTDLEPKDPESWELEKEETSEFNFESDLDDDDFFTQNADIDIQDTDLSSKGPGLEMENSYEDTTDNNLDMDNPYEDMDDDFSFEEDSFDMTKAPPLAHESETQESLLEFEEDLVSFDEPEPSEQPDAFDRPEPADAPEAIEAPLEQSPLEIEKDDLAQAESFVSPDLKMDDDPEPVAVTQIKPPDDADTETETENDLPPKAAEPIDAPPKKEKKVIVKPFTAASKPKPVATAKPTHTKGKKKSASKTWILILLLILLLGIGGYLAMDMTGYKLPMIDQYIKKPVPEISEAKPIPNQKSVNGRFVTNSTAGTLFVITGRVENPSNMALSHIEIRGALITKDKAEAKIKNAFCGNIITEEMLKTGNISDIDALLTQKEGAHKINVNVAPGASVPFMVVFSDLPEKLENFTIKIAGFDTGLN